jgi:hypothetical protein
MERLYLTLTIRLPYDLDKITVLLTKKWTLTACEGLKTHGRENHREDNDDRYRSKHDLLDALALLLPPIGFRVF